MACQLRIFSYLPNPRVWKATIAARLCGVEIELRGAKPNELQTWLWDFDARPLLSSDATEPASVGRAGFKGVALRKTQAFLDANPFGTVPAAFSPDGKVGIFESNSIMRAVARLGDGRCRLYGNGPYEASRVDGFLDASLLFARESQTYMLSLGDGSVSSEIHTRARDAFATYLGGVTRALQLNRRFLVGDGITLADICFVAELALFSNESTRHDTIASKGLSPVFEEARRDVSFTAAFAHFDELRRHPAFAPDVELYLAKIEQAVN